MIWRRQSVRSTPIDTIIGQHTRVQGGILGSGGIIRIEGHVEGDVEADGMVVLGEGGKVAGDIHAHDVVIGGRLIGDVTAPGHLELLPTGHLEGTVLVGAIIIGDGAVFDGVCHIVGTGGNTLPASEADHQPAPPVQPDEAPPVAETAAAQAEAPPRTDEMSEHDGGVPPAPVSPDGSGDRPGTPHLRLAPRPQATTADEKAATVATEVAQPSPWVPEALSNPASTRPPAAGAARPWRAGTPTATEADAARPGGKGEGASALNGIDAETAAMLAEMEDGRPGFPLMPPLEGASSRRVAPEHGPSEAGRERPEATGKR